MGYKELLTNQRDRIAELRTELAAVKRQNAKMTAALKHAYGAECELCRMCRCPKFERLFNEAYSRQLLNLRVESRQRFALCVCGHPYTDHAQDECRPDCICGLYVADVGA